MMKPRQIGRLLDRYRITDGADFRMRDHDPDDTGGKLVHKDQGAELLAEGVARLAELHEKLYAGRRWAVLALFQAMDAAGKDSAIKHVMSGVNPQGVTVTAFKSPSAEELDHGFLWRVNRAMPPRGHIGIFNRSHYEEVLMVRLHPPILAAQRLPDELVGKRIWDERLQDIAAFERYAARQGTVILKFFLNVSKAEQKKRFLERLDQPGKNWKFAPGDITERERWNDYMTAYEQAIQATARKTAPWFVVPADNKWFTRLVVVAAMIEALEKLDLRTPEPSPEIQARFAEARQILQSED
jgi:PPK2 family polyphosphate:nucleotide phosphotransferase